MAGRRLAKTITKDEAQRLLARPNLDAPTGLRDRCMMELMYRAGLRVGEVCGLQLRDVDWDEGIIRFSGKGDKERTAYLDAPTLEILKRWKGVRRKYAARQPHLFTTLRGGPVNRKDVWEMVVRRAERAGIERHVTPHMLRHTFATELLGEGFNIREVQELVGHADVRTTQIYTHVMDAELKRKIRSR